jgi:hypothetical protein
MVSAPCQPLISHRRGISIILDMVYNNSIYLLLLESVKCTILTVIHISEGMLQHASIRSVINRL